MYPYGIVFSIASQKSYSIGKEEFMNL